jgi:hypothetical protein
MESDLDPRDPEPYFAIGRIDSIECYYHDQEVLLPGDLREPGQDYFVTKSF